MKVTYNSVVVDEKKKPNQIFKPACVPCCDEMKIAIQRCYIAFGYSPDSQHLREWQFTKKEINPRPVYESKLEVCVYSADIEDGELSYSPMGIKFCPFCGTKIEVSDSGPVRFKIEKKEEVRTTENLVPETE